MCKKIFLQLIALLMTLNILSSTVFAEEYYAKNGRVFVWDKSGEAFLLSEIPKIEAKETGNPNLLAFMYRDKFFYISKKDVVCSNRSRFIYPTRIYDKKYKDLTTQNIKEGKIRIGCPIDILYSDKIYSEIVRFVLDTNNGAVFDRMLQKIQRNGTFDEKISSIIKALQEESIEYKKGCRKNVDLDRGFSNCVAITTTLKQLLDLTDIEYRIVISFCNTEVKEKRTFHIYLEVKDDSGKWRYFDGVTFLKYSNDDFHVLPILDEVNGFYAFDTMQVDGDYTYIIKSFSMKNNTVVGDHIEIFTIPFLLQ